MLGPQLRQGHRAGRVRYARAYLAKGRSPPSPPCGLGSQQSRGMSWWRHKSDWLSKSDPRFQRYARDQRAGGSPEKPQRRAAAADGDPAGASAQRWRKRVEEWERRLEEDPYSVLFGPRNEMLAGRGFRWPRWMREEMGLEDACAATEGVGRGRSGGATPAGLEYDPITNRMVPKRPEQPGSDGAADIPVKPWRGRAPAEAGPPGAERGVDGTPDDPRRPQSLFERELRERLGLSELSVEKSRSAADPLEPSSSRSSRAEADAAALADPYDRTPCGLQTSFAEEQERRRLGLRSPAELRMERDAAALAQHVDPYDKAPQGLETSFAREVERRRSGTMTPEEARREQQQQALARHIDPYDRTPQGLETSFAREVERERNGIPAAEEIRGAREEDALAQHIDPYDKTPQGLQTSFARERAAGRDLAQELGAPHTSWRLPYDDGSGEPTCSHGYPLAPTGLQTHFERERASGRSLEAELKAQDPAVQAPDDGYSHEPLGLQTQYARERASGRSLEKELGTRTPGSPVSDDGYSREPTGLQTSYARELSARQSEISRRSSPQHAASDDGYSREPTGLQTSYAREKASGRSLADELKFRTPHRPRPADGYAEEPMGLQTQYAREKQSGRDLARDLRFGAPPTPSAVEDGYSRAPVGLQTHYAREKDAGRDLAAELRAQAAPLPSGTGDGYSREPVGLQTHYAREVAAGRRLGEELGSPAVRQPRPLDDYPKEPTGLQTSYEREVEDCRNGRKTLEQEMKEAGEASLSGAFQSASSAFRGFWRDIENRYDPSRRRPAVLADGIEGRIDTGVHDCLKDYDRRMGPDHYGFTTGQDNLEAELAAQQQALRPPPPDPSLVSYKTLNFNPATKKISISTATRSAPSSTEPPLSLSDALLRLSDPVAFLPYLPNLDKFKPISSGSSRIVFREVVPEHAPVIPPINPIDGTTRFYDLPDADCGSFASPTGYVNYTEPAKDESEPEPEPRGASSASAAETTVRTGTVFPGEESGPGKPTAQREVSGLPAKEKKEPGTFRKVAVAGIWATAACYITGVVAELFKSL